MKTDTLKSLIAARKSKKPVALITNLKTGQSWLCAPAAPAKESSGRPEDFHQAAARALTQDAPLMIDHQRETYFLNPFNPPLRLIVVGAVHIAQPLCHMARLCSYDVTIIDPRTAFATENRFPSLELITTWPDEALQTLCPDSRTAVITLTHDPKLDDPALDAALRSEAFYIGALGSRKTHAARLKRLSAMGHDAARLEKISGPVGLAIGSKSPAEIALSILAEMTCTLRKGHIYNQAENGSDHDGT